MKHTLTIIAVCLCILCNAQIKLENGYVLVSNFDVVTMNEGAKYVYFEQTHRDIYFSNTNHTVYKSLHTPLKSDDTFVWFGYFSKHLFNNDDKMEFILLYSNSQDYHCDIINEEGDIISSIPHAYAIKIVEVDHNWKLIASIPNGVKVYSLPGTYTGVQAPQGGTEPVSSIYPNPMSSAARISYQLPANQHLGTIDVTDMQGRLVRSYTVSNAFSDVLVSRQELPAGVYIYTVTAGAYRSAPQKFVIQ